MILYGGHIGDVFWGWVYIDGHIYVTGFIIADFLEDVTVDCMLDLYGERLVRWGVERYCQEQTARTY